MTPNLGRRQLIASTAALVAGGPTVMEALTQQAAAAPAVPDVPAVSGSQVGSAVSTKMKARGIHDNAPATAWTDGFVTGNGELGATVYGPAAEERVIFNHHHLVLPNGSRDTLPPVLSDRLDSVRKQALAGDYRGAQTAFMAGWDLRWTQSFHPSHELVISTPANTTANDYLRVTGFRTGEVSTRWSDAKGVWQRRVFSSRPDRVIAHELAAPAGATIDATLSMNPNLDGSDVSIFGAPINVTWQKTAEMSGGSAYLNVRGTYPAGLGAFGYEGVTRVVATGGTVTVVGDTAVVAGATTVLLLTQLGRYETADGWDAKPLQAALAAVTDSYDALLTAHIGVHAPIYDRSTLDLKVSAKDRLLTTSALIARQSANPAVIDLALLERMFDSGRYFFLSSSGIRPPRLTGLWTGSWDGAWADDFTTDANINLQIAGGNILDLNEPMQAYITLILGQLADYRVNAKNLYGARGFLAPTRTDGEYGHMLHFGAPIDFPGLLWTGGADWLLSPLIEYYQVSGDEAFYSKTLAPALMELALFYEDYLAGSDSFAAASNGKLMFVPSYSPENSALNETACLSINATSDVMAGRHALTTAIKAAKDLGVEQGSGQGVARWTALLAKLPPYLINTQGGICEWSWAGQLDNQNHRHVSHLYAAWPLHEINPEDRPELVVAGRRALELRQDENLSAHGDLHRALASARLKDGNLLYVNLRKIFGNDMIFKSLMTSHNPQQTTYNADAANTLPAILAEALVYSRPGLIELLPAVPEQLAKGTITGVRGRNQVRVDKLSWDLTERTLTVVLRSQITQQTTLVSRRGIGHINTSARTAKSALGAHARVISLTAGKATKVTIGLPQPSGFVQLVNRWSGKVLDVKGAGKAPGHPVVQSTAGSSRSQHWHRVSGKGGTFRLVNRATGQVLSALGSSTEAGAALVTSVQTGASGQSWRAVEDAQGFVTLVNVRSGLLVDVTPNSVQDNAPALQQTATTDSQSQQWRLLPIEQADLRA